MSQFVKNYHETQEAKLNVEFCPTCGTILDLPESGNIVCNVCHFKCTFDGMQLNGFIDD